MTDILGLRQNLGDGTMQTMAETTHYANPPITEALIDIRVTAKEGARADEFDVLHEAIKDRYPSMVQLKTAAVHIKMEEVLSSQSETQTLGRIFQGDKYVFQARTDGMTLSRRPKYEDWKSLHAEFNELWQRYAALMKPQEITRLAVRYINRLDLPFPFSDFKEYVLTCPEVAPGLSQSLSGFLMQLHIPQPDIQAMLILNEGLVPPPREGVASVLLDIDLYRDTKPIPTDFSAILETLHKRKNEVFEACITDKMRELIK